MNRLVFTFLALLLSLPYLRAQDFRGSITVTVVDGAGQPVAEPSVKLTQVESNRARAVASRPGGEALATSLPPGEYLIEVERPGFRRHVEVVTLLVNQDLRVEVTLAAGQPTETVNVTARAGLLKTESASTGGAIENRQIVGLPLDGRNFYELSLLLPGVLPPAQGSAGSVRGDFAVNVNGSREDASLFLLDGVYNGDPKLNGVGVTPPVDAIREFEVQTGSYDATFGRNAGGQVNVLLKSGANGFHGAAYEFFRNAAMDARNFFAPAREPDPRYQRNQFGFAVGGPVRRDRTFFFADYEGRRIREGLPRVTNVPTALERAGDFSQSGVQFVIDPFTQRPFPSLAIPAQRIDPVGRAIANLYPLPNRAERGQNFASAPILRDRNDSFDLRLDHALARNSDLSFRYSMGDRDLYEPFAGGNFPAIPGYGNNVPRRAQNASASETHVFSPTLINEVRVGFNRVAIGVFQENQGVSVNRQVGLPELSSNPADHGLSFITIPGFSSLGQEFNNPQSSVTNTYQLTNNTSWTRGRHLLRFGGEVRYLQQFAYRHVQSRGFLNFVGFTGNPLAELLLGMPTVTGGARLDNDQNLRGESYNLYLQDTFRVSPNFTLTAGLRYELNSPPVDPRNRANLYDPATGSLTRVGTNGIPRAGYTADRNNFAPRIGWAWTPGGGGTVLRGGYGVYYDQSALAPSEGLYFNAPYFDLRLYILSATTPIFLRDPFPANWPVPTPPSGFTFQRDLRTPYVQHWNFTIQQRLGSSRVLEVGYVGSKGAKLFAARDINQPAPSSAEFNLRPNPRFQDISRLESRSSSNYHSLQARFQQQVARGLSLLASYTFGKSIDDASNFFPSAGDPNFPQDSYNVRAERARSNFDVRHRLVMSYTYDLPQPSAAAGALRAVFGGWQTNGIWTFQTGRPFTVALLSELDRSNTGRSSLGFGANDRPNVVGDPEIDDPRPERWFNTAAFALQPFGSFGNSGRNILDGPGLQTINLSLLKNARLTEAVTLQLRGEAFNALNRANFNQPDNFFGSPTFGRIQSAGAPRRLQLGVKFLF
ncbi:MAG: carboxypeptidase regulatory-like domain-containing protein [Bryobacteraceae bacterium]|nr:carboxypeptidase regulatory-like domain-containing protein [Bryobacteraceae bacterium]